MVNPAENEYAQLPGWVAYTETPIGALLSDVIRTESYNGQILLSYEIFNSHFLDADYMLAKIKNAVFIKLDIA